MATKPEFWVEHGTNFPYHGIAPTDASEKAALAVLANLCDRRGIKWELNAVDDDVRAEIVTDLSAIIREATKCA